MRNILIFIFVGMAAAGCAMTPKSITRLSTVELQYLSASQEDAKDVVETYDAELRHWVRQSFRYALQDLEKDIVRPDGTVDLEEYKRGVVDLSGKAAEVMGEYDRDKAKTLSEIGAKYQKMMVVQMLIDQYEHSTGTSPETLQALLGEMVGTYGDLGPLLNSQDKPEAVSTWEEQVDLITRGLFERVRQSTRDRLIQGAIAKPIE